MDFASVVVSVLTSAKNFGKNVSSDEAFQEMKDGSVNSLEVLRNSIEWLVVQADRDGSVNNVSQFLSLSTLYKLRKWLRRRPFIPITKDVYRIDFGASIYIFRIHEFEDGKVLSGTLVNRTPEIRASLLDMQSQSACG